MIMIDTDKLMVCTICGKPVLPAEPKVIQGLVRKSQVFRICHQECWDGAEKVLHDYSARVKAAYRQL